jgi:hypothetical protein
MLNSGQEHLALVLRAAWEVEGLVDLLHDQIAADSEGLPLRSMLRRIKRLASVQMSALSDVEPLESLQGRFEEKSEA